MKKLLLGFALALHGLSAYSATLSLKDYYTVHMSDELGYELRVCSGLEYQEMQKKPLCKTFVERIDEIKLELESNGAKVTSISVLKHTILTSRCLMESLKGLKLKMTMP